MALAFAPDYLLEIGGIFQPTISSTFYSKHHTIVIGYILLGKVPIIFLN
jgi:hypothetical protein